MGINLEANGGIFSNEYMKDQAAEVFKKYALGKGSDLAKAEAVGQSSA